MIKVKNPHLFNIGMVITYMDRQCLPVNNFDSIKDTSQFSEDLIKKLWK